MNYPSLTEKEAEEGLGRADNGMILVLMLRELREITKLLKEIERRTPDPF